MNNQKKEKQGEELSRKYCRCYVVDVALFIAQLNNKQATSVLWILVTLFPNGRFSRLTKILNYPLG